MMKPSQWDTTIRSGLQKKAKGLEKFSHVGRCRIVGEKRETERKGGGVPRELNAQMRYVVVDDRYQTSDF